ncbi:hypothetical protein FD13_GL000937 [Levilactobacillus senmaizukei DSM 21775 = NBRC 103853]|uniref:Uncharacterized protein n=1 Tax=Levilactobacillus senmaizukei DSM 21775 = NBRC 103853 TaxID=1423803 RepID=A0A0R2DGP4_9LACO|nr:hypothetical protein [Levilactobacillus senmaizukei]KRN03182.1 hypothetical protein FD13_GL000937 [Levilactobacillus senmaizukei DSM 21775 = NBRC 103853]
MSGLINDLQSIRIRGLGWILLAGLFLFANLPILITTSVYLVVMMVVKTWLAQFPRGAKWGLTVVYGLLLALQIVFYAVGVFPLRGQSIMYFVAKALALLVLVVPLWVERFVTTNNEQVFYLPTIEEAATVSFDELRADAQKINNVLGQASEARDKISLDHLKTILADLPRHSATHYINHGTLTSEYFDAATATLDDLHLYLAVSNTGSAASEMISVFTQKQFNHVSLAFDRNLDTIISYNGGDNVYPPGMNAEALEFFHQKDGASLLVYSLPVTREQKQFVVDKIAEINREGSAYNMVGLVAKHSFKPNILFCSQFVYKMLKLAGVAYFDKREGEVRPTDFIELDYYKQLKFEYGLKF